MAHSLPRYQPSGFFRPTTIVYFLGAMVGGCLLAFVYQAAVRWISIVQVKALMTIIFAALLGGAGMWAVRKGHCRNALIATLFALVLAGVPLASTYYWDYALAPSGTPRFQLAEHGVTSEYKFRHFLEDRQRYGWQMAKGGNITGWGVLVIWTLEGLVVLGAVLALTVPAAAAPYCEHCGSFCPTGRTFTIRGLGRAAADPLLAAGALGGVIDLEPPPAPDAAIALNLSVTTCPTCDHTAFLSVWESRQTMSRGKAKSRSTSLVKHAVLSTQHRAQALARLTSAVGQKLPAAR